MLFSALLLLLISLTGTFALCPINEEVTVDSNSFNTAIKTYPAHTSPVSKGSPFPSEFSYQTASREVLVEAHYLSQATYTLNFVCEGSPLVLKVIVVHTTTSTSTSTSTTSTPSTSTPATTLTTTAPATPNTARTSTASRALPTSTNSAANPTSTDSAANPTSTDSAANPTSTTSTNSAANPTSTDSTAQPTTTSKSTINPSQTQEFDWKILVGVLGAVVVVVFVGIIVKLFYDTRKQRNPNRVGLTHGEGPNRYRRFGNESQESNNGSKTVGDQISMSTQGTTHVSTNSTQDTTHVSTNSTQETIVNLFSTNSTTITVVKEIAPPSY